MSGEAIEMRQVGQAENPTHRQPSYLEQALGRVSQLIGSAGSRSRHGSEPDGLEAFDMLGGWKGSDASRRDIR